METKVSLKNSTSSPIVVLEGQAPKQYNNNPVTITGTIDAPYKFLIGKKSEFGEIGNHCLVSKSEGLITLIMNEQSVENKYTIIGKVEISKKFHSLGINSEKISYSPEELANKLKLLRNLFVSNNEHLSICTTLRTLKAKINKEIEESNDKKGNVSNLFKQSVESNIPNEITLTIPLIEGDAPTEIKVAILLEADGNSIKCYLESIEASEQIENAFTEKVSTEIQKISPMVTVIEI